MLTKEQLAILRAIHSGNYPQNDMHAQVLLERGLVTRQTGTPRAFAVTDAGRKELKTAEGFGDAIVDAILPGEGSRQAARPKKER
jgi:DNA-binding MarR family transcriptional regulator